MNESSQKLFGTKDPIFTNLLHLLFTTGPLILNWTLLQTRVKKSGALKYADTVLHAHNFVLSQVSIVLAAFVFDMGYGVVAKRTGLYPEPEMLGYIYHLLKIYESLDVLLLVAAGETKVSKYVAFTSIFMPYWSFYRIIQRPSGAVDWRTQVMIDCFARFAVFTIPYVVDEATSIKTLTDMCEEFRWYPEIVMFVLWLFFKVQDQRESEKAIEVFGKPWDEEPLSRVVGLAIVLYASYSKRQEDKLKAAHAAAAAMKKEARDSEKKDQSTQQTQSRAQKKNK